MSAFSIDLHCHPAARAYSQSFKKDSRINSTNRSHKNSIWHYDPPSAKDRLIQRTFGLTNFTQADCTTLAYGNVRCVCASVYSIEREFVTLNVIGDSLFADFLANMISSYSHQRINFVQKNYDYFTDMQNEYLFYLQLHDKVISFADGARKYKLVKNFADLESSMLTDNQQPDVECIYVIMTVEGMHDLNSAADQPPDGVAILNNLRKMKQWEYPPFFVTFAHHFYNGLCGHAETLSGFVKDFLTHQEHMMDTGINDLGWEVIEALIDTTNGRQIHIDIKHMSYQARKEYIYFLKTTHAADYALKKYPIIISHGACNGKVSPENPNPTPGLETTAARMYPADINFYDEEIIEMAKSGGIIGLQLDERRIASPRYIQSLRKDLASANQRMHSNSKMVWNNIQHIVQLLDSQDMFAWENIAIGSDFNGLIDPINMFWTAEEMDDLVQYIERHAYNFLNDPSTTLKSYNQIEAAEVVERVFHHNAYEFFRKYF